MRGESPAFFKLGEVMELPDIIIQDMKNYGIKHLPEECCGLVVKHNHTKLIKFYPIKNVSPSPDKWDYVMDPNEYFNIIKTTTLFNKHSKIDLLAIFHTHPGEHSHAIPSTFDVKGAQWKTTYIIYAPKQNEFYGWDWVGNTFKHVDINGVHIIGMLYKELNYKIQEKNIGWEPWKNIN